MKYVQTIINTIGNTPLIQLNKVAEDINAKVLVKNESVNPTRSITDRVVAHTLQKAKARNIIRDGATLINATSANMALSFAMISITQGYRLIAVISDKESNEKIIMLKALGAEVIVTPNDLTLKDSRSKYAVAQRLHKRTPNSWLIDHTASDSFFEAYYQTIGKELWEQTSGKFQHIIVPVNTGTAISAIAKYIKERDTTIKIWGVDAYGSVLKRYFDSGIYDKNEIYPYEIEGIGASFIPSTTDFSNIHDFIKVSDRESSLYTSALATREGLFLGMSSGACIGALHQLKKQFSEKDVVIILATDGGERYMSKVYNKEWMRSRGFLNKPISVASDLIKDPTADVITVKTSELVSHAVTRMRKHKISQIPVIDSHGFVGSIDEMSIFNVYLDDHRKDDTPISEIMKPPFPIVNSFTSIEEIAELIRKGNTAVIVALDNEKHGIITKSDVISHLK